MNNPVGPRIAARKHRIARGGGAWRFMGGPANAPGKYRRTLAEKGILHADGVFSAANMSVWKGYSALAAICQMRKWRFRMESRPIRLTRQQFGEPFNLMFALQWHDEFRYWNSSSLWRMRRMRCSTMTSGFGALTRDQITAGHGPCEEISACDVRHVGSCRFVEISH